MTPGLIPGKQIELTFAVTEGMCPAFDGHIVHRVCATWTLVQYMEVAGRKLLVQHLEPEEEGVGSHVSCDHLGPARIGETVRVVAVVAKVDHKTLLCDVTAWRGEQLIARGQTEQKILPRTVLKRILEQGQ